MTMTMAMMNLYPWRPLWRIGMSRSSGYVTRTDFRAPPRDDGKCIPCHSLVRNALALWRGELADESCASLFACLIPMVISSSCYSH